MNQNKTKVFLIALLTIINSINSKPNPIIIKNINNNFFEINFINTNKLTPPHPFFGGFANLSTDAYTHILLFVLAVILLFYAYLY